MPRYYFHLRTAAGLEEDPDGADFPSLDTAKSEASKAAREMLSDRVWNGEALFGDVFEIASEDGTIMATIPFKSVSRSN